MGRFVRYYLLHNLIDKIKRGEPLNNFDAALVEKIIKRCEGRLYPSKEELKEYKEKVKKQGIIDKNVSFDEWNELEIHIKEFEKKYYEDEDECEMEMEMEIKEQLEKDQNIDSKSN